MALFLLHQMDDPWLLRGQCPGEKGRKARQWFATDLFPLCTLTLYPLPYPLPMMEEAQMDDSVRAEFQRRLDEGDKPGALSYLRMLRTQADDGAARDAYTAEINHIENSDNPFTAAQDTYSGSSGPFGDNNANWEGSHQRHHTAAAALPTFDHGTAQAPDTGFQAETPAGSGSGSFGNAPAASTPAVGAVNNDINSAFQRAHDSGSSNPPAATHHTPDLGGAIGHAIGGVAAGSLGLGGQVGNAIGDRIEHALDNVTGHSHPHTPAPPPATAHQPAQHHGLFDGIIGHKTSAESTTDEGDGGSVV